MNQEKKTVRLNRHGKEVLDDVGYENFIFEQIGMSARLRQGFKKCYPELFSARSIENPSEKVKNILNKELKA